MPDEQSVIPAALAKALSDKLYDKQRAATLKIERLVLDALEADDEKKIYRLIAELSTDFATSEKESARIGGLVALAATAVALTHINIRPFLPHMVPPMVSALSDGESKVRYFACESLYNVAKVSRGFILRWFNDIFDGLARVTADSVKTVKDGADYLDRLFKDIVAEQAATCLDWYDGGQSDVEASGNGNKPGPAADGHGADAAVAGAPRRGSADSHAEYLPDQAHRIGSGRSVSPDERLQLHMQPMMAEEEGSLQQQHKGPRLAFSLEKFVPLLAERMHTYKPSTRLYLIEWIRVLDSVPGLDLIVYLPEFFDGLLRFLSDPNDDVRNRTQSLLGELLSEIRECVEMQTLESEEIGDGGGMLHGDDEYGDDDSMGWAEGVGYQQPRVSKARVRSSTLQSAVHAEGRFADDPPRQLPLGVQSRQQHLSLSRRPSRAPSAAGSVSGVRAMAGPAAHFYHNYPADRPHSRTGSRAHLHVRSGSGVGMDGPINRSAASIMSSALASGQLHGVTDELKMAARRKKIRAERASNALIPGAGVAIDFARCIDILVPHLESNDQEIQGTALGWILQFTWLCPQVIVQFVPRLVNAVLPSVSHPMPTHRHTAEDVNLQLYELVSAAPDPVKREIAAVPREAPRSDALPASESAGEAEKQQQQRLKQQQQQQQNSLRKENSQWASSVPSEIGAKPAAARPLPPVTSTATAAVGSITRPQSPSLSAYSVASAGGQPLAVRSRAGSLLQATSGSPAPSSLAATPALQPADKVDAAGSSRPQSPPATTATAAFLQPGEDNARPELGEARVGSNEDRDKGDDSNEVFESGDDIASVADQLGVADVGPGSVAIDEPFNYEHAATAIMELFAKNVHEPTKVCGMQWLLLLHRKAPWRILTPEDMSFPVLLKMLSDSSEQVIKLDLQLFAQISLYSQTEHGVQGQQQGNDDLDVLNLQKQHQGRRQTKTHYDVDPRSTPYLSRFFGSLLQMFATDRVLLETRAALMVRQLCVVLDPELVFCLFARLLTLPRFSIDPADQPAADSAVHAKSDPYRGRQQSQYPYQLASSARGSSADLPAQAFGGDHVESDDAGYALPAERQQQQQTTGADVDSSDSPAAGSSEPPVTAASSSAAERMPSLESIGDEFSDVSDHAAADDDVSDNDGCGDAYPGGIAPETDSLVDLEFVGIMVQHLSWILVTAPETEKLRLILRRYSVQLACYSQAPRLSSIRDAILGAADSRATARSTASAASSRHGMAATSGSADRARTSAAGAGNSSSGVRRRGGSTAGGGAVSSTASASALAKDAGSAASGAASDASAQSKPSKLVRVSTGASNAAIPAVGSLRSGRDGRLQQKQNYQQQQQQQQQQQAARNAQRIRRAKQVLSQAMDRIQHDVELNEQSHGLFVSLFRAWSYNPAACLTLCLLSQHYEIAADLVHAFGQLTQDMTVSFLVQLDKLVQLIESPVFTYLRLQLLDPLQHPLLVRTLYGLLMMLPQSSAFAILRNRLSTVAMLPSSPSLSLSSGPALASLFQQSRSGVVGGVGVSQDPVDVDGGSQQQGASQVHYHYHYNYYYHPSPLPSSSSSLASAYLPLAGAQQREQSGFAVSGGGRQLAPWHGGGGGGGGGGDINCVSAGATGAGAAVGGNSASISSGGGGSGQQQPVATATGGLLSSAMGIQPADLHELVQLLTVSGKQQQQQQQQQQQPQQYQQVQADLQGSPPLPPFVLSSQQQQQHISSEQKLASASSILQQLAGLQISAGAGAGADDAGIGGGCVGGTGSLGLSGFDVGSCGCACHGVLLSRTTRVDMEKTKLVEMYRGIRSRYAQALARNQGR